MSAPSTSAQLREHAMPVWETLIAHPFPAGIADATLAPERLRFYLAQNLRYLPDYARMIAVAASCSVDDASLQEFTAALVNIVSVEIPENRRLHAAISELSGEPFALDDVVAPATAAYTSWLLATAATGDAVDIAAALLPCAWSYGEIARTHAPTAVQHPVYTQWLAFFASDDYAAVVDRLIVAFDRDLATASEAKRERLAELFVTGCRMERQFWDQAFARSHWPDLVAELG